MASEFKHKGEKKQVQELGSWLDQVIDSTPRSKPPATLEELFAGINQPSQTALSLHDAELDKIDEQDDIELSSLHSTARLLRHIARPPALSEASKGRIASDLWAEFEEQAAELASQPKEEILSWSDTFLAWFGPRPSLALAGVSLLFVVVFGSISMFSPIQDIKYSGYAEAIVPLVKLNESPWPSGQNPFDVTKSPSERLDRVWSQQRALHQDQLLNELGSDHLLQKRSR